MPKFIRKPEHAECMEYEDVRFEAMVTGKPTPEVIWCCGDNQVLPGDRVTYEVLEGNRYALVMRGVTKEHSAMYTVKASNDMGTMSASARLKVTHK